MWELEETVPVRVRAFWARVVALYEMGYEEGGKEGNPRG
jgi:hypothetical protein